MRLAELLADIETGKRSAADAIADCHDRIAGQDDALRAFVTLADRDAAIAAARKATGPLAGVALGVRNFSDTHARQARHGSPIYADNRPPADAALVAMARAKGATIIGKTVTTEFAWMVARETRNPHNAAHTPGGSSSGSAAAVAAGMIPAATGTQTGGSVIRPAAFCGVAGYKPSFRLLPTVGVKTFSWTLDTLGLFGETVEDVALLADLLTGRPLRVAFPELSGLRIGLYRAPHDDEASAQMRDAVQSVARQAEKAGARIVEVNEPEALTAGRDAHSAIQNFEAALALGHERIAHRDLLSDRLRALLDEGAAITPADYDAARAAARRARKQATALFDDIDVLLTPSAPGAAPRGLESTGSPIFNKLWTLTGNPCINVPGCVDSSGLPLGLQVVARFGRDATALAAAAAIESVAKRQ